MRLDVVMLYGWKKAREKKHLVQVSQDPCGFLYSKAVSESLFAGFSSSFWPIILCQFEELLLDDPEVDAIAAPAGLLVDTDLRM